MGNKNQNLKSAILFFISIFIILPGFSQTKFTEQKSGNIIYMSIPNYLVKTKDLNDSAILQYMNSTKEAYLVVLDDSKDELEAVGKKFETASDFQESIVKPLAEGLKNGTETAKKTFKIGSSNYSQSTLSGVFTSSGGSEFEIIYLITCVETPNNFYQILCWSIKEFYNELAADFDQISRSLKEGDCK